MGVLKEGQSIPTPEEQEAEIQRKEEEKAADREHHMQMRSSETATYSGK